MSMDDTLYTQSDLTAALRAFGLTSGQAVMLHASVKAIGKVMGGPNVILGALLDVLGADGTLVMYAGWEDIPDFVLELPPPVREIYYAEHPAFDPAIARAVRENSVLAEFLRTWPGAVRSHNPEASMVAVGKRAEWITANHALNYGYGVESPLAKLVDIEGHVLLLGAPLDTVTLLHHAEYLANIRHKQVIHYQCPLLRDGQKVWVDIEDYDTGDPHDDYTFEQIVRAYLDTHPGQQGKIGNASAYLMEAKSLTAFAVHWLEDRFGDAK